MTDAVAAMLWPSGNLRTYAVIDAAAAEGALEQLYGASASPEVVCLWPGDLPPDLAHVAPYLVRLDRGSGVGQWFLSGWGKHWGVGIVAAAASSLSGLANHLRKFNMVMPAGAHAPAYLRWYDPRVLPGHMASLAPVDAGVFFGPIERFVVEAEGASKCAILLPPRGAAG